MSRSWLDAIHQGLEDQLPALLPEDMGEEEAEQIVTEAISENRSRLAEIIIKDLRRRAPQTLKAERKATAGFEARLCDRWKPAFDLYEQLLLIITEVGGENDSVLRPVAVADSDWKFEAISHLHARSLLVGREIYALLKAGYPDGALARWRALHEHAVIALFISQCDPLVALRYLAGFHVRAHTAAVEVNDYALRANLTPFSSSTIADLAQKAEAARLQAGGHPLKKEFDWALPGLNGRTANFREIELATGMDHWRPRYRWACQHNHGGHRPWMSMLGMSESESEVALVGGSNSGFVDPLHMSAISLLNVFSAFLFLEPNIDRIIMVEIAAKFVDELGETALRVSVETLARARQEPAAVVRPPPTGAKSRIMP